MRLYFYYWFLICYWNNDPRADKYFERADRFVMLGLILLVVEPAFILFTINLVYLGLLALVLWFPFIVLLAVVLWSFSLRLVHLQESRIVCIRSTSHKMTSVS